jgi:hypothetical protein
VSIKESTEEEMMVTKLRMFVAAALAATAIGAGSVVAAPSALAAPKTCAQAKQLALVYILIGDMLRAGGHPAAASGYYGRAEGLLDAAC